MTQLISRNHSRKPSLQTSNQLSVEIRKNENTTEKGLINVKKIFAVSHTVGLKVGDPK